MVYPPPEPARRDRLSRARPTEPADSVDPARRAAGAPPTTAARGELEQVAGARRGLRDYAGRVPRAGSSAPRPAREGDSRDVRAAALLTILAPAILVGAIELLSDTFLDPGAIPADTLLVVLVVLGASILFSHLAFERSSELERRSTRGTPSSRLATPPLGRSTT